MKLNKREKTWYDLYHKKSGTIQERIKNFKAVNPYSKEGQALQEESAKKHGRAWWMFNAINFRSYRTSKTWIEQFYVQGIRGPNKKRTNV